MRKYLVDLLYNKCGLIVLPKLFEDKKIHMGKSGVSVTISEVKSNSTISVHVSRINSKKGSLFVIHLQPVVKSELDYLVDFITFEESNFKVETLSKQLSIENEINKELKEKLNVEE